MIELNNLKNTHKKVKKFKELEEESVLIVERHRLEDKKELALVVVIQDAMDMKVVRLDFLKNFLIKDLVMLDLIKKK